MGKWLKLLEKSGYASTQEDTIVFHSKNDAAFTPEPALQAKAQLHENPSTGSHKMTMVAFMVIVSVISIMSLYINQQILKELKMTKLVSARIINDYEAYQQQVQETKDMAYQLQGFRQEITSQYQDLKTDLHKTRSEWNALDSEVDNLNTEHKLLKISVTDLQAADEGLMDKYIELNNDLLELNTQIQTEGRNI